MTILKSNNFNPIFYAGFSIYLFTIILSGCKHKVENPTPATNSCSTENISFSTYVQPFLKNNCGGCHSRGTTGNGNIGLLDYASVVSATEKGRLLGAISHSPGFVAMPEGGSKMAQCDIDKIASWIKAGTPNN